MKCLFTALILVIIFSDVPSQTFSTLLGRINSLPVTERAALVDSFLNAIPACPVIEQDTLAHFIYRGTASSVTVPGDANNWSTTASAMTQIAGTDLWYRTEVYENDARLDYKFYVNGNWILDPHNPNTCFGGFGPNSELRMPAYEPPKEISYYPDIRHGTLQDTSFYSMNLGNRRTIRIYLPPDYHRSTRRYPMMLFHDGPEYISLAQANHVLDYLIHHNRIEPIIGVFVPPVNRSSEYAGNLQAKFTKFIIEEIIPWVDTRFRTIASSDKRAVLGASYGGNISLWLGLNHPDIFGHVAAQSSYIQGSIFSGFQNGPKLDLDIHMILGTYDIASLIPMVRNFIPILDAKGYSYRFHEYHEGHSWGFWKAHIDDALEMFFPFQPTGVKKNHLHGPEQIQLLENYPNPFNSETTIRFFIEKEAFVSIKIFNVNGQAIRILLSQKKAPGEHSLIWDGKDDAGKFVASGIYFCQLLKNDAAIKVLPLVMLK